MANSTGLSKTAGRIGSLLCTVGVIAFFIGIFGGPRSFAFAGLGLMIASFVAFFLEEHSVRKLTLSK